MTNKKEKYDELDVCTQSPEFAEHARPNEPPADACDDGRGGTQNQKKEAVNTMTDDKKKNQEGEDFVEERKKERQETMDKMSIDSSDAHTYNEDKTDNGEKSS
ncbi:MAG: hypothetical protein R6U68_11225 [Desulfobacteraceae bacterium]